MSGMTEDFIAYYPQDIIQDKVAELKAQYPQMSVFYDAGLKAVVGRSRA